jgi:hypothetical protein
MIDPLSAATPDYASFDDWGAPPALTGTEPLAWDGLQLASSRFGADEAATPAAPAAAAPASFEPRLLQPGEQIRGNLFFGGAGMQGGYIQDMVRAFSEQGMALTPVNPDKWSGGTLLDVAIGVDIYRDRRFPMPVLLDNFAQSGPQFNLLGYSYGSVAASQVALHYADGGTAIDNLVLMGSPLGDSLLGQLRSHPNIRRVQVLDLGVQGDPIHAGMSRPDLLMAVPTLMQQMPVSSGHFYYSAPGAEGRARRDALADFLHAQGLR